MTVHFIGAGPGAMDLITVRGLKLIREAFLVLYAGSLVPEELVKEARHDARVINTAPMNLDEIVLEIQQADMKGKDVARVHSGDPSLYGAIGEQMRRLDDLNISYDITPGVPAYAAAAAALQIELTLPNVSQTVILTRTSTRSSPMPDREGLEELGKCGGTLAIHLSVNNLQNIIRKVVPNYGEDCPVAIVYRVGWPEQRIIRGTLKNIRDKVKKAGITRTALILIGNVIDPKDFNDSRLYSADHHHILRPQRKT